MLITFKQLHGPRFSVSVPPTVSVGQLKALLAAPSGTTPDKIRLVFGGECLEDDETAQDLGLSNETDIMAVVSDGIVLKPVDESDAAAVPVPPLAASIPVSAASEPATVVPAVFSVSVKRLDGSEFEVSVSKDQTLRELKVQLEERTGLPVSAQAIVFRGGVQPDHLTLFECGMAPGSLLHLVKRNVNLSDVYRKDDCRINCRFCHVAGALVVPRAVCPRCGSEAVVITFGSLNPGEFRWIDLLRIRIACMPCGDLPSSQNLANIGFLCMAKVDGVKCPSRQPFGATSGPDADRVLKTLPPSAHTLSSAAITGRTVGDITVGVVRLGVPERKLQFVFRQSHANPEQHLQETLNALFGYAHAAGVVDSKK